MTSFCIRLGARAIVFLGLIVSLTVGLPAVALMCVVALPGILLSTIPARLGCAALDLGRFGVITFGSNEKEKAQFRTALALVRRDLRRLRHPIAWPS
jgi:hypothetical protein